MNSLSRHYHQLVGLSHNSVVADVQLDVQQRTLTLLQEFVGDCVVCPECGAASSMKDAAVERGWRHLDAMQFQTILTARVVRCSRDTCGVKTIAAPWADRHSRFTLFYKPLASMCCRHLRAFSLPRCLLGIDWSTAQVFMKQAVARGLERRSLDKVRHVEIDEKSFEKSQD